MTTFSAQITPVYLDPLRDGRNFRLLERVRFSYGGKSWELPKGFQTDLASIPWFCRWLVGRWGKYGWGAIWHDGAYRGLFPDVSRAEADRTFLVFMRVTDTPAWQQVLIYYSVRLFGWLFWKSSE